MLRQQSDYGDSRPNRSLADYVAPAGDHLGAFAVGIFGADELAARFEAEHDDYRAILAKALADRFAEAFAEFLHEESRRAWYEQGAATLQGGADRRGLPRHPPGLRLPGLPRPLREGQAVRPARRGGLRARADRVVRGPARRRRQRDLPAPPGGALLLRRPCRPRPGRVLRRSQGPLAARRGAVAAAEPRLRAERAGSRAGELRKGQMEVNYGKRRPFSLGVEEEFQLVNGESYELSSRFDEVFEAVGERPARQAGADAVDRRGRDPRRGDRPRGDRGGARPARAAP